MRHILDEEASKRNPGRGIHERESSKSSPGAEIRKRAWSESLRRGIMLWRHQGGTQETPRGTQEAPTRPEAPSRPTGGTQKHSEGT